LSRAVVQDQHIVALDPATSAPIDSGERLNEASDPA